MQFGTHFKIAFTNKHCHLQDTLLYFLDPKSSPNLRPSLVCLMEIFAGLLQLTYITIQCILQVWIWREKFFSIFFQRRAIKEKMFDSFLLVATQGASWVVVALARLHQPLMKTYLFFLTFKKLQEH